MHGAPSAAPARRPANPALRAGRPPRRFVAGGSDMWVRLHDYETGEEVEVCKGEFDAASGAAAAPQLPVCATCGRLSVWGSAQLRGHDADTP